MKACDSDFEVRKKYAHFIVNLDTFPDLVNIGIKSPNDEKSGLSI